ncbi:MAG: N-acetyl-alpha-D-glucosaminyl L-malate synthase BshA [Candidatus Aenigmarchaeota archaeon]|nr:N-acetyl-alpha-D-glucosaminyl L-malate synthase BshA [Candidatus Aenigmarchaeota archaeon]
MSAINLVLDKIFAVTDNIIDTTFKEIETIFKTALARPIKVCIVASPGMGGSGIMGSSVASKLSDRGHDVHLISYRKPFRLDNKNVRTHYIPLRNYQVLEHFPVVMSTASKLYDVVKKHEIDIINVHYAIPYSAASYLAREMFKSEGVKIPIVTTVHGTDVHTIGQKKELKDIVRFTLKSSDGITTVCNYLGDQIKKKFNIDNNVKVIYNYVDTERFKKTDNLSLRKKLGHGEKVILHASNFRAIKNIDDIINTFRKVRKNVPSRLVLVGDGPEKQRIKRKVSKFKLSKSVLFAGSRKDMEKFYSAADIFMLTSIREGCPLSILEAMSSSLPIVSTKVGGIPEVVQEGKTGHLTKIGDVENMADKTIDLLTNDKKREKMGNAARSRVLKKFTADKIIPQYESYYKKLLLR